MISYQRKIDLLNSEIQRWNAEAKIIREPAIKAEMLEIVEVYKAIKQDLEGEKK